MASDPTEAPDRPSPAGIANVTSRAGKFVSALNLLGLLLAWAALFIYFTIKNPDTFATFTNVETIARQATIVSMAALGMTMIIIAGAIDLSIGSTVALVTVVIALALHKFTPTAALFLGVAAGATAGFFNGLVITKLKVAPFVVTLGTLLAFRGISRGIANDKTVSTPQNWLNDLLSVLDKEDRWKLFPIGVWFMLFMALLVGITLKRTVFGRQVVAVGSNEVAARMSGVHVQRVKLMVYVFAGVLTGLAGLMQFSRLTVGDPTVAVGLELDVIAATVIGGASLSGGQGSIIGSIVGALFMTTISNGFSQMGLPEWVKQIVTGSIIVIAVALDRLRVKAQ
jgi:ribose transport system permease protein